MDRNGIVTYTIDQPSASAPPLDPQADDSSQHRASMQATAQDSPS